MKKLVVIFYALTCHMLLAQTNKSETENWATPFGVFDTAYDGEGNAPKLNELIAGKTYTTSGVARSSNLLCTSGIFELYFETGCGMEVTTNALHNQRRALLFQAFQDVSNFINTPLKNAGNNTKVKIWIKDPTSITLQLHENARGRSYHVVPYASSATTSNKGGISDGEVWRTIHTGKDSYTNVVFPLFSIENPAGIYHGYLAFNFSTPYNYTLSKYNPATAYPTGSIDFYTQALHEITHMLGLSSLLRDMGASTVGNSAMSRYYSRYDKQFKGYLTPTILTPVITNTPATEGQMYAFTANLTGELTPGCPVSPAIGTGVSDYANCNTSIQYSGGAGTFNVYTPQCFEKYFSFSHLEDSCYSTAGNDNYFLLSNRENGTMAKRTITPEERLILNDIGYSLQNTFGSTANYNYKNYGGSATTGITIGGVNDAFTTTGAYSYQGNSGTDIILSGFLANDYIGSGIANIRFEFMQDVYDSNATFSTVLGDNTTNITYKSYVPGIHVLRYVPYDVTTGQRGNITYIIINVLNNCISTQPCELVKNGNFEEYNLSPNPYPLIMNSCGWQNFNYTGTSDYFNSTITNNFWKVPCNSKGYQPDKITGNHGYAGMAVWYNGSESIKTELATTLQPNTQYQLKFDVSLAESRSQKSTKFQAFITDQDLPLTSSGTIPTSAITPDKVFLSNSTFSNAVSGGSTGWETITFTFTTSSNPNLKYLYLGALYNVVLQNELGITPPSSCTTPFLAYAEDGYYYVDNVSLVPIAPIITIDAINDNFSSPPIIGALGGVTTSVYANDLYNGIASNSASLPNVTFALVAPLSIAGATINSSGLISIPAGTAAGTYTLTYRLNVIGNCNFSDTATVTIVVTNSNSTPNLVAGIRANNAVHLIELQSTNKSIISGYFTKYNNISKPYVARLNTDLTLDQTFTFTGNQPAMDLAIQPDDKIIAATWSSGFGGTSFGITRLLPNGGVDTSFNLGGIGTTLRSGYSNNMSYSCALQADGKILLGGDFYYYNGVQRLGIVRINSNGSIDTSFNPTVLNTYYRSIVTDITIQPNGQIILLGLFSPPTAGATQKNIIRLNADGSIDTTFTIGDTVGSLSFNGVIGVSLYSPIAKAVLQPDGKIIIAGAFDKYNGTNVKCLVRLNTNGSIDTSFNTATGVERAINELILEPTTNKLIIGGEFTLFGTTAVKKLIRLNTNGTLDTTFSIGTGTTDTTYSSCFYCLNYVKALKQQPDGKIIVGGKFTTFNDLSATNITRIFGSVGVQAKSNIMEFQSEPEIDTNPNYNAITIYPNPSKGIYSIDLSQVKEPTTITVFNILGEQVFKQSLTPEIQNQIDISNVANGYYIARINNESLDTIQKIIKN